MKTKDIAIAILAGGNSSRYGMDKALVEFHGKLLVTHMIEFARRLSDRVIIAVGRDEQIDILKPYAENMEIVVDPDESERSALNGAVTAFEFTDREYTLLLPVDSPLAKYDLFRTLIELSPGHSAIVPSWPNGYIEPLHSVYRTELAYSKGLQCLESGKRRMRDLLEFLPNVLYISTEVLKQFDENLESFTNLNTPEDMRRIEQNTRNNR